MTEISNIRLLQLSKGNTDKLTLETQKIAMPEPGNDEALIRILTCGMGLTDLHIISGAYFRSFPYPLVPGYDMIGVIEKLGTQTKPIHDDRIKVGSVVGALTSINNAQQYRTINVSELVFCPTDVDPSEAVALVLNYLTAYQLLHQDAKLKPSDTLLVHGAAGGCGTALIELARLHGVKTIYGTCSGSKKSTVEKMGAIPIDYKTEKFEERIKQLTNGRGVDVIAEAIGGDTSSRSWAILAPAGRLVSYGFSPQNSGFMSFMKLVFRIAFNKINFFTDKRASFFGVVLLKESNITLFRKDLGALFELLQQKKIQPLISARVDLKSGVEAYKELEAKGTEGKMILICDEKLIAEEKKNQRLTSFSAASEDSGIGKQEK